MRKGVIPGDWQNWRSGCRDNEAFGTSRSISARYRPRGAAGEAGGDGRFQAVSADSGEDREPPSGAKGGRLAFPGSESLSGPCPPKKAFLAGIGAILDADRRVIFECLLVHFVRRKIRMGPFDPKRRLGLHQDRRHDGEHGLQLGSAAMA